MAVDLDGIASRMQEPLVPAARDGHTATCWIFRRICIEEGQPEILPIGGGMTVGRNPAAGEKAWVEIFSFLGKN